MNAKLRDPDGDGVESCWNQPNERWSRRAAGELAMFTKALDLEALLKLAHGVREE
jgi:catechol 2,3-dioxygenase